MKHITKSGTVRGKRTLWCGEKDNYYTWVFESAEQALFMFKNGRMIDVCPECLKLVQEEVSK